MNQIMKLMFQVLVQPALGLFVSNSSALITDMSTARDTAFAAATKVLAIAAAGPITDLKGVLSSCVIELQQIKERLAYILEGTQVSNNLSSPTGGVITVGNDATAYNALVGIYQILT